MHAHRSRTPPRKRNASFSSRSWPKRSPPGTSPRRLKNGRRCWLWPVRHRGRPLEHEPVVPELVLAILQLRFNRLDLDAAEWQEMAASVAATLLDAPDVRAHLQSYWDRLGQALP